MVSRFRLSTDLVRLGELLQSRERPSTPFVFWEDARAFLVFWTTRHLPRQPGTAMRRAMRHLPWLAILWPSHADELKMDARRDSNASFKDITQTLHGTAIYAYMVVVPGGQCRHIWHTWSVWIRARHDVHSLKSSWWWSFRKDCRT